MPTEARWNGEIIASSENTIEVEGNHYFPPEDVKRGNLVHSDTTSICGWKGTANYFSINAGGAINEDAAWTYHDPKPEAARIKDRIAFWNGVEVVRR